MESSGLDDDFNGVTAVTLILADAPHVSGPWQGTFTVLRGSNTGAYFPLNPQATLIGRSEQAHVTLADEGVSRSHARVLCKDGHYALEDLRSTNGTFVDGVRIAEPTPLRDGTRVQIGSTLLRFSLQDQIELDASKHVYDASVRDGLTGMLNRRYFEERMAGEFCYAARHGSSLCVLLIDVDHFKRVNDEHGHQAGDEVLREVANQLRAAVRAEDVAARYGGEEFAVLARGIDVTAARTLAERLRACVEKASVLWKHQRIKVTVSIGLSHNHAGGAVSKPDQLLASADQALYAAKAGGRNRVDLARSPGRYSMRVPESSSPAEADPRGAFGNRPPRRPPIRSRATTRGRQAADPSSDFGLLSADARGATRRLLRGARLGHRRAGKRAGDQERDVAIGLGQNRAPLRLVFDVLDREQEQAADHEARDLAHGGCIAIGQQTLAQRDLRQLVGDLVHHAPDRAARHGLQTELAKADDECFGTLGRELEVALDRARGQRGEVGRTLARLLATLAQLLGELFDDRDAERVEVGEVPIERVGVEAGFARELPQPER